MNVQFKSAKFFLIAASVLIFIALTNLNSNAQDKSTEVNKTVPGVENFKSVNGKVQELQSKLVDEYGVEGFRFIKSNEMKDIKNYKVLGAKELSKTSGLDEYTILVILAAIGAIAVILLIFK